MSYKNIFAYTPPNVPMPPFISINEHYKGEVCVTMRTAVSPITGICITAQLEIPPEQLREMAKKLTEYCDEKDRLEVDIIIA
jgi:hypothetical protein